MRPPNPRRPSTFSSTLAIRLGAVGVTLFLASLAWIAERPPTRPDHLVPVALHVPDMECHVWCPIQMDRALGNVPGIFDLRVDVDRGLVGAQIDPRNMSRASMAKLLTQRGWRVSESPR